MSQTPISERRPPRVTDVTQQAPRNRRGSGALCPSVAPSELVFVVVIDTLETYARPRPPPAGRQRAWSVRLHGSNRAANTPVRDKDGRGPVFFSRPANPLAYPNLVWHVS